MSELIEKVARAMWDTSDPSQWEKEMAGKAISAVAEWLDGIGKHTAAAELRAGSIMEAAQ